MQVVGLDGWRGGWIAMALADGTFVHAMAAQSTAEVIAAFPDAGVFAVDIPIGLPATGRRRADIAAREFLGPRRATVFHTPPRDVLEIAPYAAANAYSRKRHGFGISKQSYMLRPKILEVDSIARNDRRFFEVHPEVAFRSMSATDLPSKKTYGGVRQRCRALRSVGIELPDDLGDAGRVPLDDVLDAAAAAWVGNRIAAGEACPLPDPPESDSAGLAMAIWV